MNKYVIICHCALNFFRFPFPVTNFEWTMKNLEQEQEQDQTQC